MITNYTVQQLEAMTTEELTKLVSELCLSTKGDRRFLIENVLLGQRFPDYIQQLKADRQRAN
ncbi:hypothetical protein H6G00_01080 [Leptolyngbya sp. FACHB-541]|uniref:hypothetical protein n=1 Tax=Leptolyngbya sp. FACHB-541 TaxID=2692810 RepID=UPI0016844C64|nr:hypothetical protein [Leptolyngbya sp. FACHB-541]MBD1995222.1 hypothetical protein [Leptolyngbya sp. FACHB-541]